MRSLITGRHFRLEANPRTTTFDLVLSVRRRRLRWLGHIMRLDQHSLVRQAVVEQARLGRPGDMRMDVPPHVSVDDLGPIAANRDDWRKLARELR